MIKIWPITMILLFFSSCVGVVNDKSLQTVISSPAKANISFGGIIAGGPISHNKVWVQFKPAIGGSGSYIYRAYIDGSDVAAANLNSLSAFVDDEGIITMMIEGLEYNQTYFVVVQVYDSVARKVDDNNIMLEVSTGSIFLPEFKGISELANVNGSDATTQLSVRWSPASAPQVTVGNAFDSSHAVGGYNVYYSTSNAELRELLAYENQHNIPISNFKKSGLISISDAASSEVILKDLTPGVEYFVAVRARQSSTPTPHYELNRKIKSHAAYLELPFSFDGVLSAQVPNDIKGFTSIDLNWPACIGCARYQVYVRPQEINGDIDVLADVSYLAKTLSDTLAISDTISGSLVASNQVYNVYVIACKTNLCLDTKGNGIFQSLKTIPSLAPFNGASATDRLKSNFPDGVAGMSEVDLEFSMDITRGYYSKIRIYHVKDAAFPPSSVSDLANTNLVSLLGRIPGDAGVAYINSAYTDILNYNNHLSQARISGMTTGQKYCFIAVSTIEAPDLSAGVVVLDAALWPEVNCVTPEYKAPDFQGSTPLPQCAASDTTSISISWTPPAEPGIFTHYEVYYRDVAVPFDFSSAWGSDASYQLAAKLDSSQSSATLSNLAPASNYYVGVNTFFNNLGVIYRRTSSNVVSTVECATTAPDMEHNGFTEIFALGPKTDGSNLRGNGVGAVVPENIDPISKNPREAQVADPLSGATHGMVRLSWLDFNIAATNPKVYLADITSGVVGYVAYRISRDEVELAGLTEADVMDGQNNIWDVTATKLSNTLVTYDTDKILAYTGGASNNTSLIPLAAGQSLGAINTFELLDYPPQEARIYYYQIKASSGGQILDFADPSTAGLVVKVTVPPKNMALVHRSMANMEICTVMQRGLIPTAQTALVKDGRSECNIDLNPGGVACVDTQNNYRCQFDGFGSTDIAGTRYYDQGHDLLVDRFELACNTQEVSYLPNNGGWKNDCVGKDVSTGLGISNAAFLPPLVYSDQTESYTACENSLTALKLAADTSFKLYDDDTDTYQRRLLTKKEWNAAAAWDYLRIGHAAIGELEYGDGKRSCNTAWLHSKGNAVTDFGADYAAYFAVGVTQDDPDPSIIGIAADCYNGGWSESVCNLLTGSAGAYSTDNCVSRYGVQDMVGNVWEWTSAQITAASSYYSNGVKGQGLLTGLDFDGATATGATSYHHAATYFNIALGLPMVCSGGGNCAADDSLLGSSTGNNNSIVLTSSFYYNNDYFYLNSSGSRGVLAGGHWRYGSHAGRSVSYLNGAPSLRNLSIGARCGVPL